MKRAEFLLIVLLFLTLTPCIVHCASILDVQDSLDIINTPSRSYTRSLTGGTTVDITIDGVSWTGSVDFHLFNSTDGDLLHQGSIGTNGYHAQWKVPYDDTFEFLVELTSGDQTGYHLAVTSSGGGQGGGFDPTLIIVGVVIALVVVLVVAFMIIRIRKQPSAPTELPPPPPPPPPP